MGVAGHPYHLSATRLALTGAVPPPVFNPLWRPCQGVPSTAQGRHLNRSTPHCAPWVTSRTPDLASGLVTLSSS